MGKQLCSSKFWMYYKLNTSYINELITACYYCWAKVSLGLTWTILCIYANLVQIGTMFMQINLLAYICHSVGFIAIDWHLFTMKKHIVCIILIILFAWKPISCGEFFNLTDSLFCKPQKSILQNRFTFCAKCNQYLLLYCFIN